MILRSEKIAFILKGIILLIGFPNNKYTPNTKNYLPCLLLGEGGRLVLGGRDTRQWLKTNMIKYAYGHHIFAFNKNMLLKFPNQGRATRALTWITLHEALKKTQSQSNLNHGSAQSLYHIATRGSFCFIYRSRERQTRHQWPSKMAQHRLPYFLSQQISRQKLPWSRSDGSEVAEDCAEAWRSLS